MIYQIKSHFERNKNTYIIIGIAGITYLIMRRNIAQGVMGGADAQGGSANTASFIFRNKQTIKISNVLARDGRGHPGWPVQNIETKQVFFSQKDAASAFDIPEGLLSGHLKGKFPDVDGLHFERVNLVAA
jgi:hypothetical protein